ncbi:MAG: DUF6069 family protein [Anaerolineae bacterium]|nr:DUF6069 family protein [Anaerolineae bacterium]
MAANSQPVRPAIGSIWKAGIVAAVVAAAANTVLYFLGRALGAFPDTALTPMGRPVDAVATIMVSVLGVLAATVVYTILARLLDVARAKRWFLIIAIVVLVLMAPSPFGIPGAPLSQVVIMEIMHLVAGISAIYFLTRWKQ